MLTSSVGKECGITGTFLKFDKYYEIEGSYTNYITPNLRKFAREIFTSVYKKILIMVCYIQKKNQIHFQPLKCPLNEKR